MRCLVTGATGYVGGRLVPRLLAAVTTCARWRAIPASWLKCPGAKTPRWCVAISASPTRSLRRSTVSTSSTTWSIRWGRPRTSPPRSAAQRATSSLRRAGPVCAGWSTSADCTRRARSSHRTWSRGPPSATSCSSSGIETVVLQAGVIIGSGSASFEMIRHLTDRLPAMTTPKWVHNKIQPIAIRDVLHYLIDAAVADVPASRTWDIGGPDVLEYGEMMQIYAELAGLRRRFIVVLPFLTPTIASWWVGLVTPIPSGLARPLVESLHCNAIMADHDIDAVIDAAAGWAHRLSESGHPGAGTHRQRSRGNLMVDRRAFRAAAQRSALGWRNRLHHNDPNGRPRHPTAMERHRQQTGSARMARGNPRTRGAAAAAQPVPHPGHHLAGDERQRGVRAWQPLPAARNLLPAGHRRAHLLVRRTAPAPAVV